MSATQQDRPKIIYNETPTRPIYTTSSNTTMPDANANEHIMRTQAVTDQKITALYDVCDNIKTAMSTLQQSIDTISETLSHLTLEDVSSEAPDDN